MKNKVKEAMIALLERGCQIEFADSMFHEGKTVKITGGATAEEYTLLKDNVPLAIELFVEVTSHLESIESKVNRWRKVTGPHQGYNWNIRNWKTDYLGDVLAGTMAGYEKGECSEEEVKQDFDAWADAHKVRHLGSTPQVEPQTAEFTRMLTLLGTDVDGYMAKGGVG